MLLQGIKRAGVHSKHTEGNYDDKISGQNCGFKREQLIQLSRGTGTRKTVTE